ncbi:hypothetical protein KVR01_001516 [Diaporthe batatas]|uniref:uncharacterized protein n=1 Tax=Diaporthe batatas TaxID=748121 RepID=UPI001D041055|nr:uncharacterized protein KVR01_001516 [Diaporthe batatas]KAG8168767.1 hypothetical protein KVR01_001516 [Diaporthe batatas]
MSPSRKSQDSTATSRSAKPKLTIDTRVYPKPAVDPPSTQSAPVGTRREKGIPPMYQATDRHCTKVAEMMSSPTWRSQRPWTSGVEDGAPFELLDAHHTYNPSPLAPCVEDDGKLDWHNEREDTNDVFQSPVRQRTRRRHADSGISLGRDAEAMNIIGIHPLSDMPGIPNPNKTFIISASLSNGPAHARGAMYGELQPVIAPKRRSEFQNKFVQDDLSYELLSSEHNSEYGSLENGEKARHGPPPSLCHPSGQFHGEGGQDEQGILDRTKYRAWDFHLLMERDAAIKSVNSHQAPQTPHRRPDPEDTQRFQGLLGRLRRGTEALKESPSGNNTLNDPAIISFEPKENKQRFSHREQKVPFKRSKSPPKGNQKRNQHAPSDSGYASSSTRTQSRSRHGTSDEIGFQPVAAQNGRVGSKGSGPDRSPKSSTLNPAAKEFSLTNNHSAPLVERNLLKSPASTRTFLSPPLGHAPFGIGIHPQSFGYNNTLPIFDSPFANLALPPPASLQVSPALLPQTVPFPLPALPPQPGLGFGPSLAAGIHGLGSIPSLPLRPSPSSLGLARQPQPPESAPVSGPIPSEFVGAFHQQLPTMPSCNNPAHQNDAALNAAQGFLAPTMPQLPPPAPPASLFGPTHNTPVPASIAPPASVVNPIFRKNVPKPKVPNTTGQQYWEYWHELRRTFEPGYAQKSKQNQQKRYMKQQVYKNGGTVDQA